MNLCPEDTAMISIPTALYKTDHLITNAREFTQILRAMIFWGLDQIPETVLTFCETHDVNSWSALTQKLPDYGRLHTLLTSYFKAKWSISATIATGRSSWIIG